MGYPFVKLGTRDILLAGETYLGDYTLPVDTGPRSSFGTISTRGDLAFDAAHVNVLKRFEVGELYDSRQVYDLRDELVATGLFTPVSVLTPRIHETAPDRPAQ